MQPKEPLASKSLPTWNPILLQKLCAPFEFQEVCARAVVAYTQKLKRTLSIPATLIYANNLASQSLQKLHGSSKFLLCPTLICDMCEDGVAADEDVFRWYRFDDEIWSKDKMSTLAF
ncbi:F-box/LRR-repeat protein [Pyrus ussuriensis x Pyrus communis]|uniref:F-box/LRR-repeat protein n=1 Tax=Pyrus ussuriensis x Pyrus communis TaxID=2448454 RepID=A0A5N5GYF3_9ROSA|nr:F-box/LRR-repeat protein [Pyrus ussuriensis x Pyrus communis]